MSAEIEETDTVLALEPCWHGLENIVEIISSHAIDEQHKNLYFHIKEGGAFADLQPGQRQVLLTECRTRGYLTAQQVDELMSTFAPAPNNKILTREFDGQVYALSVPTNRYCSIENGRLMEAVCGHLENEGLGYTIQTAGTLKGGKLFFSTIVIDGEEERLINGDVFKFYLNVIQSHDGSYSIMMYDSNMRIVCSNTFRASLGDQGDINIKIRKTKNAGLALDNASETLASIYAGRDIFVHLLKKFAEVECDEVKAEQLVAAWNGIQINCDLSTRAFNTIVGIADLHTTGIGNNGETLYDLFNAVTQYYTGGDGTGRDNGTVKRNWSKFASAEFGTGADKKAEFSQWLLKVLDDNALNEEARKGGLILADKRELLNA